jgi:ATP-dependent DNA ligase
MIIPMVARLKKLAELLHGNERLRCVDHLEQDGIAMFARALVIGIEGIVVKDAKSQYVEVPRETWHWQKINNRKYERKEKIEFNKAK